MKEYSIDYFSNSKWVFVLIKDGEIVYCSKDRGLKPLIFCLRNYKAQMQGAVVFDKIVGRAAALFLICGKVKKIFSLTISQGALNVLKENGVGMEYKKKVENILNKNSSDVCLMEKLSQGKTADEFCKEFI